MATDSHITDLVNGEFDAVDKIASVQFGADDVFIAQAGLCMLTDRVIEVIREKAKGLRIKSPVDVREVIESAIREVQEPFIDSEKEHAELHVSGLIAAYYIGKKPYLDTLMFRGLNLTTEAQNHYAVIGVGDSLGKYLLKEYLKPDSGTDLALAIAIYAIGKIKQISKFVGGEINVRKIWPVGVFQFDQQYVSKGTRIMQGIVNKFEKEILKKDEKSKEHRNRETFEVLRNVASEVWVKYREKVEKDEAKRLAKLPKNNP